MKALVLSIRGLHLGYLGCYGNEWIATPNLDGLASEGVVFDQHISDAPAPATARRTWRSGRYSLPGLEPLPEQADLIELFRGQGLRTVLVLDASRPAPPEFLAGWDEVRQVPAGEGSNLRRVVESARRVLHSLAGQDGWLVWVDLAALLPPWQVEADFIDPYFEETPEAPAGDEPLPEELFDEEEEGEYEEEADAEDEEAATEEEELIEEVAEEEDSAPPEEELAEAEEEPLTPWLDPAPGFLDPEDEQSFLRLQSSYAGAVTFLDDGVGDLIACLVELNLGDQCALVVTTDHGLPLGEHGSVGLFRPHLHEELIHLPLLLYVPESLTGGRSLAGNRVAALTQPVDLAPTLLGLFGLSVPASMQGHDLLALAQDEMKTVRERAFSGLRLGLSAELAVRTPEWAFLLPIASDPADTPRERRLYCKPEDRWEVNDVIQHHLELADELEQAVREFARSPATGR